MRNISTFTGIWKMVPVEWIRYNFCQGAKYYDVTLYSAKSIVTLEHIPSKAHLIVYVINWLKYRLS